MVLAPNAQARWTPTVAKPWIRAGLIVYRFGADLFCANADRFADGAPALIDGALMPVRRFVVRTCRRQTPRATRPYSPTPRS